MSTTAESAAETSARYQCALCKAEATHTEKDGMGYCDTHWRRMHPLRFLRITRSLRHTPTQSQP